MARFGAAASLLVLAGACGGRVDAGGAGSGAPSAPSGARTPSDPPDAPSTARATLTELATSVAKAYCAAFGACCTAAAQPPIDVARCETVTADAIVRGVGRDARRGSSSEIEACAAAVAKRASLCPNEDAPWPRYGGSTPALLLPTSVYPACAALVGGSPESAAPGCPVTGSKSSPVGPSAACPASMACAIDSCLSVVAANQPCDGASACVDSAVCTPTSMTCGAPQRGKNDEPCGRDGCEPGLVCAGARCAPARLHAEERRVEWESPYSVRRETCRRFEFE